MISGSTIQAGDWGSLFQGTRCPELLRLYRPESAQHLVQFYEDESFVIENVSFVAAKALAAGHSSVLIATEPHLQGFRTRMTEFGINPKSFHESGRLVTVEAEEALSHFMVDGDPDETKFQKAIGGVLDRPRSTAPADLFLRSAKWWLCFARLATRGPRFVSNSFGTLLPSTTAFPCTAPIRSTALGISRAQPT